MCETNLNKVNNCDKPRRNTTAGRIHSIESFGTVDGPGIRMIVFCQGCPMRCAYCHNPDTWAYQGGTQMTPDEILKQYDRNAEFYRGGGITLSGGEPLAQPQFALALFRAAHAHKDGPIHTCLDTSGGVYNEATIGIVKELLQETDLVMLDIKHSDPKQYKWLTGRNQKDILKFGDLLAQMKVPVLIRHVIVPGITDTKEELEGVGRIIACWPNVKGLELLPYHTMGVNKYEELGYPYRLEGVEPMDKTKLPELRKYAMDARARSIRARIEARKQFMA